MALSREEVSRLAELSRLTLTDDELERMEKTLDPVLAYVGRLSKIDTTGVPETEAEPVMASNLRADQAAPATKREREAILANFPDRAGDLLKVPGVFEKPKG
jgi:aspartyl-tRNA(Asn)/glutamyl-tRNA(Gln) amidotransferase subunit C